MTKQMSLPFLATPAENIQEYINLMNKEFRGYSKIEKAWNVAFYAVSWLSFKALKACSEGATFKDKALISTVFGALLTTVAGTYAANAYEDYQKAQRTKAYIAAGGAGAPGQCYTLAIERMKLGAFKQEASICEGGYVALRDGFHLTVYDLNNQTSVEAQAIFMSYDLNEKPEERWGSWEKLSFTDVGNFSEPKTMMSETNALIAFGKACELGADVEPKTTQQACAAQKVLLKKLEA